jgi:gamma-glutamyltranspeptidase/glutathione hydrolase
VEPAIRLAREGVPLSDDEAQAHSEQRALMADDPAALAIFFRPDGNDWQPGDRFRQTELAWTLSQIARRGPDGFYRGPVAQRIVAAMQAGGGIMTADDLANYRAIVTEPVWSSYRGHRIAFMPPGSSGVTVAETMNILEHFPVGDLRWGSAAGLHVLAEAVKIASSDRRLVGGGPDWRTPVAGLISKPYAAERAALIRMDGSLGPDTLPEGNPYPHEGADTTHYSVADQWGNVVSNTYTLSSSYGAHVVAAGTGVLLNNSMGNLAWEQRDEPSPATLPGPNKRVGSTITPLIVYRDDRPWIVTGTPGGGYIIATMVQMLSNVIDHNLNIAEAAQRPRINQGGAAAPLELEAGFSSDLVPLLEQRGHRVRPSNTMGSTQSIMIDGDRFLGAADTRRPDALAEGVR